MAKPRILYDSILRNAGAIITASSSAVGFPVSNLFDYRATSFWKSGVLTSPIDIDVDLGASGADDADTLGLLNGNLLAVGATVQVFADTFTPPTTSRLAAGAPSSDDAAALRTFAAPGNLRYWRVRIAHAAPPFSAAPFLGEMFLGLRLDLPEYMDPSFDPYMRQVGASSEHSEGGHYLGAVLRGQQHRESIRFGEAGAARSAAFDTFIHDHAMRMRPFLFQLDADDASDFARTYYLVKKADADIPRRAVGGTWLRSNPDLAFTEAYSEAP